jgi:hypothetical protein
VVLATPPVQTATVACAAHVVRVDFSPRQRVVVTSGGARLAFASFTRRSLSSSCRRVGEPRDYTSAGLGAEIRRPLAVACTLPSAARIHVNPITGEHDNAIGSSLQVGVGNPLRVIVSAILKNRGDPRASRIYVAKRYCRSA